MRPNLSKRELAFVVAFVRTDNAKQSAIEAGYAPGAAVVQGSRLLTRDNVKGEIARIRENLRFKHDVKLDRVIAELAKIGFANMGDYMSVGSDGLPRLHWGRLTKDQQAAIAEVTVDVVGSEEVLERGANGDDESYTIPVTRVKFKLHDKRAALVDLGKHLGLFEGRALPPETIVNNTTIINQDNRVVNLSGLPADELARIYREKVSPPRALPSGPGTKGS